MGKEIGKVIVQRPGTCTGSLHLSSQVDNFVINTDKSMSYRP